MGLFNLLFSKSSQSSCQGLDLKNKTDFLKMTKSFTANDRRKFNQFAEKNLGSTKIKNEDILKKVRSELGIDAKIKLKRKFAKEYTDYQEEVRQKNLKTGMQDRIDTSGLERKGVDREALGNIGSNSNNGFASDRGKTGFAGDSKGSNISIFNK